MKKTEKVKEAPKPKAVDEVTANRPSPRGPKEQGNPGGDHWRTYPSPYGTEDPKAYGTES